MVNVILEAKNHGHDIKKLNVGGGLGIKYTENDDPPSIDEWVKTISTSVVESLWKFNLDLPILMCEPGRSIVSTAGITIYKIGALKKYQVSEHIYLLMVGWVIIQDQLHINQIILHVW